MNQNIVLIGGGTGLPQIAKGLKSYANCKLTAIANMCDDGGHSGELRDELGVLPPGDIRNAFLALVDEKKSTILRPIWDYRFPDGTNLGNLIITAAALSADGITGGLANLKRLFPSKGVVIPVTQDMANLMATTEKGEILKGQFNVSYPEDKETRIKQMFYEPKVFLNHKAFEALQDADKIVICPGDFYGSIIPNFIVEGMQDALMKSRATKIFVCNLVTKHGNYGFKASDFVREIEKYTGVRMDKIVINNARPTDDLLHEYLHKDSELIEDDLGEDHRVTRTNIIDDPQRYKGESKTLIRHNPQRVANVVYTLPTKGSSFMEAEIQTSFA